MYNSRFILKSFKENNKSTRKNHRTLKKILAYAKVLNIFLSVVQFISDLGSLPKVHNTSKRPMKTFNFF